MLFIINGYEHRQVTHVFRLKKKSPAKGLVQEE
jgi:hypothetical protein